MSVVRIIAAVIGGFGAVAIGSSVVRALIVPRPRTGSLFLQGWKLVDLAFLLVGRRIRDYRRRDRILAVKGPAILLFQLGTWLVGYLVSFGLLLWPHTDDLRAAMAESGSSMFTLGYVAPHGAGVAAIDVLAAISGLAAITLQIAYLPSLYSAFNRRETLVALLHARAGLPPWGPELLARTKFGIVGDRDDLPAFYAAWENWAADVAESHANYPVLVQFRSPDAYGSWLIGLIAVLDSAAMLLAVAPSRDRIEPRLCLRMGFTALRQIADATHVRYDPDPDPDSDIELSFAEFEAGCQRLRDVGFVMEREPEEAWPHFRGWRTNYEAIAYSLAYAVDAVPALWSGPRRVTDPPMAPSRPANRMPTAARKDRPSAG